VALQAAKTNADKANALRARASMGLASIGHAPQALADAEQALALDQAMGASARVIADLSLLAQLHSKAGHAVKARDYQALEKAAKAAREQLRLK
jgi:hypothetical protein